MTTLEAIGFTCAGGGVVFFSALAAFGIAVKKQSPYVAPRCTARAPNTIYNPNPQDSSQDRGNPVVGWIPWSWSLSYDTMLKGVPGTGTRKDGLEGSMLGTTMDAIVLVRFHSLCYKITRLATVLCLAVILPMNITARCYKEQQVEHALNGTFAESGCDSSYNLTNYDRTTLVNIPALTTDSSADVEGIWGVSFGDLLGRMYGIALCTWIVTIYTCYLLRLEWIEVLAMRRVYYLEDDVWNKRKKELQATLLRDDDSMDESPTPLNRTRRAAQQQQLKKKQVPTDAVHERMQRRDPWIPHPEQRDTVPNVGLYSVLVGNLPSLPQQAIMLEEDVEAAVGDAKKLSIDWQLSLTTTFFDQCVPNQPGYSSSVAAVTILPAANDLAQAWKMWTVAAAKLRRLRYIRRLIKDMKHYDIEDESSDEEDEEVAAGLMPPRNETLSQRAIYKDSERNLKYFTAALGSTTDEEVEANFLLSMDFGPEQFAVYSREFAQAAALCCPNGCCVGRLKHRRIDELLIMEQEVIAEVEAANVALMKAQAKATVDDPDSIHSPTQTPGTSKSARKEFQGLKLTEDLDTEAVLMAVKSQEAAENKVAATSSGEELSVLPSTEFNIRYGPETVRRRRNSSTESEQSSEDGQWALVESMVGEFRDCSSRNLTRARAPATGEWRLPKTIDACEWFRSRFKLWRNWAEKGTTNVVDTLARDSTYAVVTFTSRQAAVAARHCLEDGRGLGRWTASSSIPTPPLADSPAWAICPCRGCCRPVTLSINDRQKRCRNYLAITLLAIIYIFYTVPLTFATSLVDPSRWANLLPNINKDHWIYSELFSGILPAMIWTLFFALCPVMFKAIANFGSGATSVVGAEYKALQYYWWFMIVTAFSGNSLAQMMLNGWDEGLNIGSQAQQVLANIAATIPTQVSATWINWIIVRTMITLPCVYMLQLPTYLLSWVKMGCCSRLTQGGGPGAPVPYRMYIDCGVVLLCVVALAPASPLLAPFALVHYLLCEPLLKRNLIFTYRAKFDGGGIRWPFLFEVVISSLLLGHVLLVTMLALKKALGPAIIAALPFIPTLLYRRAVRNQFLQAYQDAGLVQTSMLDGWDIREPTSVNKREEFRRFLVDAHKAAYVPVCIAGSSDVLTAEPAVVIPQDTDEDSLAIFDSGFSQATPQSLSNYPRRESQYGVATRRIAPRTLQRSSATRHFSFNDDGSMQFSFNTSEHAGTILEEPETTTTLSETKISSP